jgi:hypothetical protein
VLRGNADVRRALQLKCRWLFIDEFQDSAERCFRGGLSAMSWAPEILRSGIDYGIHLEQLARAFLAVPDKPKAWPVFAAEIRAMEQMDIPMFFVRANDTELDLGDGSTVPGALRQSSYDAMIELLTTMCETDLARQLAIIQGALHAVAIMALARKLSHVLYALWKHRTTYDPARSAQPSAA